MWSSWAFCKLVHISMPTPCLSIKWNWYSVCTLAARFFATHQIYGAVFFSIFVNNQCATTNAAGVHHIGRFVLQCLVWPLAVVEHKVVTQTQKQLAHRGIAFEVNVLVLDVAPQPLDKDVVKSAATPVHADGDALALEYASEVRAGELRALVTVKYVGLAEVAQRLPDSPRRSWHPCCC